MSKRDITSAEAKEAILPDKEEKKQVDFITEERLEELINILLPYGYSHYTGRKGSRYTGLSPYIGEEMNVISIIANDPAFSSGGVFSIVMEAFTEEEDEKNSLGFYKGIMKVIAPELHSKDDAFDGMINVLDFYWADDNVQENAFNAVVKLKKE